MDHEHSKTFEVTHPEEKTFKSEYLFLTKTGGDVTSAANR